MSRKPQQQANAKPSLMLGSLATKLDPRMKTIIVTLQGASLSAFGCYGNEWIATPNLDRFAAEGIVFDRHIIETPDVAATRKAMLSNPLHEATHTVLIRANRPENDLASWFYESWGEMFDARPDEDGKPTLLELLPSVLSQLQERESWLLWIDIDMLLPPWDIPQDLFNVYIDEDDELEASATDDEDEEPETIADINIDEYEPIMPIAPWSDPPYGPFDSDDQITWEYLHRSYAALMTLFDAEMGGTIHAVTRASTRHFGYLAPHGGSWLPPGGTWRCWPGGAAVASGVGACADVDAVAKRQRSRPSNQRIDHADRIGTFPRESERTAETRCDRFKIDERNCGSHLELDIHRLRWKSKVVRMARRSLGTQRCPEPE